MRTKTFGSMTIVTGLRKKTRGKNPTCKICDKSILPGEIGVMINNLSECPREHHFHCLKKVLEFIEYKEFPFYNVGKY